MNCSIIPPLSYRKQKHLTRADIPDGTISIGDAAFSLCPLLKLVTIPASVEHIGVAAFCGSGVEEVTFLGIPKVIEQSVFAHCDKLKRIIVPKGSKSCFAQYFNNNILFETDETGSVPKQNPQYKPKQTTTMNINEIISTLKEDYALRNSLRRKNFAIQEELNEEISNLEKQYITSSIIPQLEAYAKELLKDLECEVYLAVKKDINGNVSVDNELVSWEDVHAATEEDNTPNVVQEPDDDTIENESSQDTDEGNDTPRSTRGGRKKFKVILNGKEVPGTNGSSILTEVVKLIGYRKVAAMNILCGNKDERYNLVDRRKRMDVNPKTGKPQKWQEERDGWFVYTNMPNPDKIKKIKEIAEKSGNTVQIEMLNENEAEALPDLFTSPHNESVDDSVRGRFKRWMEASLDRSTVSNYLKKLDDYIPEWIRQELDEPDFNSIYDYTTPDDVQLYIELLKSSDAFMQENIRMHNSMTAALGKFLRFVESGE